MRTLICQAHAVRHSRRARCWYYSNLYTKISHFAFEPRYIFCLLLLSNKSLVYLLFLVKSIWNIGYFKIPFWSLNCCTRQQMSFRTTNPATKTTTTKATTKTTTTKATTKSTISVTTKTVAPTADVDDIDHFCTGQGNGMYPHPHDCQKFIQSGFEIEKCRGNIRTGYSRH